MNNVPVMNKKKISKNKKQKKGAKATVVIEPTTTPKRVHHVMMARFPTEPHGSYTQNMAMTSSLPIAPQASAEKVAHPKKRKKNKEFPVTMVPAPTPKKVPEEDHTVVTSLTPLDVQKFPILTDTELIKKFMSVKMTFNQKGRIRQKLKDALEGTDNTILPFIINNKIQSILRGEEITEPQLRQIRILFNMLKTALKKWNVMDVKDLRESGVKNTEVEKKKKNLKEDKVITKKEPKINAKGDTGGNDTEEKAVKVKGPKRYVVFVGNLPLDITEERLRQHFSVLHNYIKSVRIPRVKENAKSAFAYIEFVSQPSFEVALSKHHSMLDSRRINVMYTTMKDSQITPAQAKAKRAKLLALVKAGKMPGSIPMERKRSYRRLKQRMALSTAA